MKLVQVAKMAFLAGFVAVSLLGQPFAAQAEGTRGGGGGVIIDFVIVDAAAPGDGDLTTESADSETETSRSTGSGGADIIDFIITDAAAVDSDGSAR